MVSRQKLAALRSLLRKARQIKDPLAELLEDNGRCETKGQSAQVRSYHAGDMDKELHEWCLDVCRENLAALYERVWSWSDTKKRKQLTSPSSRFLIAYGTEPNSPPIAYVNYRFELDEGQAVLYCYELQVIRPAQSRGLGRMLMDLTEQIAWAAGMEKVMLTVFCDNTAAVSFYRRQGYVLDETSPDYCGSLVSSSAATSDSHAGDSAEPASDSGADDSGSGGSDGTGQSGGSADGGSPTDSGGYGITGYHIMSKRAQCQRRVPRLQQQQQLTQPPFQARHDRPVDDNAQQTNSKRPRNERLAAAEQRAKHEGSLGLGDGTGRDVLMASNESPGATDKTGQHDASMNGSEPQPKTACCAVQVALGSDAVVGHPGAPAALGQCTQLRQDVAALGRGFVGGHQVSSCPQPHSDGACLDSRQQQLRGQHEAPQHMGVLRERQPLVRTPVDGPEVRASSGFVEANGAVSESGQLSAGDWQISSGVGSSARCKSFWKPGRQGGERWVEEEAMVGMAAVVEAEDLPAGCQEGHASVLGRSGFVRSSRGECRGTM